MVDGLFWSSSDIKRKPVGSQRHRKTRPLLGDHTPSVPPQSIPEWLDRVRLTVESEEPLMQALMMRAINAVLKFAELSEESVVRATAAPSDLTVLLTALSSGELLNDLRSVEPLAPAFIRGIKAERRLLDEYGGTLTGEQVGGILGIGRQAVDKRRRTGTLIALSTGRHGYRYPAWQFTKAGTPLPGLEDVLQALSPHDEWMQAAFFVSKNPRLSDKTPIELLKSGDLRSVLEAAEVYGEHGAA
jgi:hypothetical protein